MGIWRSQICCWMVVTGGLEGSFRLADQAESLHFDLLEARES